MEKHQPSWNSYSPPAAERTIGRIWTNVGLLSGTSSQHCFTMSLMAGPISLSSGSCGRYGVLSPLRTRLMTSARAHVELVKVKVNLRPVCPYLQRSDSRTRGAQRIRHVRADRPALYHSFFHATLREWNRCPEAFRTGLRTLTSILISS